MNKLLCLCQGDLCNSQMPSLSSSVPEGGLVQGLTVISLVLLLLSLLIITGCLLLRYRRRTQPSQDSQIKMEAALPPPPPYTRMCSAPAAISCELTRPAQPRSKIRGSLETLLKPFLKSSLSYEKSASRNNKRLETEV